jgi:hypothetical protein
LRQLLNGSKIIFVFTTGRLKIRPIATPSLYLPATEGPPLDFTPFSGEKACQDPSHRGGHLEESVLQCKGKEKIARQNTGVSCHIKRISEGKDLSIRGAKSPPRRG